jgi:phosphate transport system protein
MNRYFDQNLIQLKDSLLTMASHAQRAVSMGVKALVSRDDDMARGVIDQDHAIDQIEIALDETAIRYLALRAPVAFDLRLITMTMKISHDLERVGDEATTIARRALELNREPPLKPSIDIPNMAVIALEMLKSAIDSFVTGNVAQARAVIYKDKEVDGVYRDFYHELVHYMLHDSANVVRCLHLIVICKALERIADHASSISEEVVFVYEGRDIRHKSSGESAPASVAGNASSSA